MAKNYVSNGMTMNVLLAADAAAGDPVVIGKQVVVAAVDGAVGEEVTANTSGVWSLPKVTGAIEQGAEVYITTDGEITTTAIDNTSAGYAYEAAEASDSTVNVNIG
ncbi:DUF2190 family protein [Psychromonas sp. 14N.309.X.WAT.B.A12]|uniref:capsid cement protein n=1 Tax=Psychromonas sp. 14N.309.X.WAT.B.A12 TaxID=2998322 RepID=UPI0025AFBE90|nr:capsid cement protein [Psychromonas sp. 14N.309.X.WAT.B.A12]MDN2661846.1 DUF2190 family protein [Psychromonas sp. 14N.309.X.WAT.B.A12]